MPGTWFLAPRILVPETRNQEPGAKCGMILRMKRRADAVGSNNNGAQPRNTTRIAVRKDAASHTPPIFFVSLPAFALINYLMVIIIK